MSALTIRAPLAPIVTGQIAVVCAASGSGQVKWTARWAAPRSGGASRA